MKKNMKKIIAISVIGLLPMANLYAQTASNRLIVPQFDNATLVNAGCDPNNWNKLVNDYTAKRGYERQLQTAMINEQVASAPLAKGTAAANGIPGVGSCFQSATSTVNGAMSQVNALMSLFSGNFDFNSLGSSIAGQLAGAACRQLDYRVNSSISGGTSGVTTQLGSATSQVGGLTVGNGTVNVGQSILTSANGGNPYSGSSQTGAATTFLNSVNPFR